MIKISNICLHQNSIFIKFLKISKIHEMFCENPRIIFVLFYDVHKKNMFRTNLEDRREAPSKASILYYLKNIALPGSKVFSTQNIDHSTQINIAFSQNLRQIGQQTNRPYIFISYSQQYLQSLCMIKK